MQIPQLCKCHSFAAESARLDQAQQHHAPCAQAMGMDYFRNTWIILRFLALSPKPGVAGFRDCARNDKVEGPTLYGERRGTAAALKQETIRRVEAPPVMLRAVAASSKARRTIYARGSWIARLRAQWLGRSHNAPKAHSPLPATAPGAAFKNPRARQRRTGGRCSWCWRSGICRCRKSGCSARCRGWWRQRSG